MFLGKPKAEDIWGLYKQAVALNLSSPDIDLKLLMSM